MEVGGGATPLGAAWLLGGRSARFSSARSSSTRIITIGLVSPHTEDLADLADFATSNNFAVQRLRQTTAKANVVPPPRSHIDHNAERLFDALGARRCRCC